MNTCRRFAVFGVKGLTVDLCNRLKERGYIPSCVVSLSAEAIGNYDISGVSYDLQKWCQDNEVIFFASNHYDLRSADLLREFQALNIEVGLCVGWQRLIPSDYLNSTKLGIFGWHGSGFRFPNGRGRSPMNWSIRLGLKKIYHNCFRYSSEADDGHVFSTKSFDIAPHESIGELQEKVFEHTVGSALRLVNDTEDEIEGCLSSQPDVQFLSFPKLTEKDGELFLDVYGVREAIDICRSCSRPFPGAFVMNNGASKVRIWSLQPFCGGPDELPPKDKIVVTSDRILLRFIDGWGESRDFFCE